MQTSRPLPSIASAPTLIGQTATRHLDHLWRDLMQAQGAYADAQCFRLITGELHPLGNLAILRTPDDPHVVEAAVTPLLGLKAPAAVLFVSGVTEAVAGLLTNRGFSAVPPMPAMAVDTAGVAALPAPEGVEFVRVLSTDDGTAWAESVAAGFSIPYGLARRLSPLVQGARPETDAAVQYFGLRKAGKLVATTMLYLADGVAGIYCVATLPEARSRGLGSYVTAETLRVARQLGYGVGVLQSSAAGHSVYRALGFRDVGSVSMFVRMPR